MEYLQVLIQIMVHGVQAQRFNLITTAHQIHLIGFGKLICCDNTLYNASPRWIGAPTGDTTYDSNRILELTSQINRVDQGKNSYATYNTNVYISSGTTTYSRSGNKLGTKGSTNANAYPANGYQGGYYWVKQ